MVIILDAWAGKFSSAVPTLQLLYPAWLACQPCRCSYAARTLRQVFLFNLHSRMLAGPYYANRVVPAASGSGQARRGAANNRAHSHLLEDNSDMPCACMDLTSLHKLSLFASLPLHLQRVRCMGGELRIQGCGDRPRACFRTLLGFPSLDDHSFCSVFAVYLPSRFCSGCFFL